MSRAALHGGGAAYYVALAWGLGDLDSTAVCAEFEEAARVVRAPRAEEPSDIDRK